MLVQMTINVGIGPGSICTTRVVAGIGVPQITAIADVYEVAIKYVFCKLRWRSKVFRRYCKGNCRRCKYYYDSSLLAGCDESPGEEEIYQGRRFKVYRGMGSLAAMARGSKDRYFQQENQKLVPEGVEGCVPYKGLVSEAVFQLVGGLRSGMGYCGAKDIEALQKDSKFIKITNAGLKESHPHDIYITKESPNYSVQL